MCIPSPMLSTLERQKKSEKVLGKDAVLPQILILYNLWELSFIQVELGFFLESEFLLPAGRTTCIVLID